MIIPARWYAGGKGLDSFRYNMLSDKKIKVLHDYINAGDCFSGVEIKGGVCYFLWDREYTGDCTVYSHSGNNILSKMQRPLLEKDCDTFIRYNDSIKILKKVKALNEATFDKIVSSRKPFGFTTDFRDYSKNKDTKNFIKIYAQKDVGFINSSKIEKNICWLDMWKIFIPEAIGAGNMETDLIKPILGFPGTVCTETYLVVNPVNDKKIAENTISYIKTKFFHFLFGLKKITQNTTSKSYSFVPVQDFSKPWTDEELYKKYDLSKDEIDFIESMIKPME